LRAANASPLFSVLAMDVVEGMLCSQRIGSYEYAMHSSQIRMSVTTESSSLEPIKSQL